MGKYKDLTGQRFERLVVIKEAGRDKHSHIQWLCKCDCGNEKIIVGISLNKGVTKSCGCLARESTINRSTKHGYATRQNKSATYNSWRAMKERCENPNNKRFNRYGGRGIKVCDEWHDFNNFLEDMGERPDGTTLDRKDLNGDYCKKNCHWATTIEQANNRSNNNQISYNGQTKTLMQWSKLTGIHRENIRLRINQGWNIGMIVKYYKDEVV